MKKLSIWARENNVTYNTAHRWFREGKMPVKTIQNATGAIFVDEEEIMERENIIRETNTLVKTILKEINLIQAKL